VLNFGSLTASGTASIHTTKPQLQPIVSPLNRGVANRKGHLAKARAGVKMGPTSIPKFLACGH